ncbi:MAG TPA: hypothetical protein VFQ07_17825 [Candidatus Polarisedimenticolia bacterium]|nr:hypothetical protein [Candidatus Polarisedimenticolia bacterium]
MSGLEQDFPGKVKAENVDASGEEARKAIKELGFKNHGLVVRDAKGKVLHKEPDHTVDMDAVKKAIQEILAQQK